MPLSYRKTMQAHILAQIITSGLERLIFFTSCDAICSVDLFRNSRHLDFGTRSICSLVFIGFDMIDEKCDKTLLQALF